MKRTTKLIVIIFAVVDRDKDTKVYYQIKHDLIAFLTRQAEYLSPDCTFQGAYMIVGIMGYHSRNGWLVAVNLSTHLCPMVSMTEQMHRSANIFMYSVEQEPDGKINNLHIYQRVAGKELMIGN